LNDVYAELCYGTLYIDVQHSVSTPGDYQGYFIISAPDNCQDVHVPFQFTISDPENVFTTIEDEWNGPFDGATTCPTSEGYSWGSFNDPTGYNDCWYGSNLGSGVELEITQAPDSSDFSLDYVYAYLCSGNLNISVQYSVSTLGDYQGYFIISAPDNCLDIHVPFTFTISDEELPPLTANGVEWSQGYGGNFGLFNGGETCMGTGLTYAYLNQSIYYDCSELSLSDGISIEFTQAPDSNDFSVDSAWGMICEEYLEIQYSVSTPGTYAGNFVLEGQESCQPLLVPFQFTLIEPDDSAPPLVLESGNWYDNDSEDYGLFNGEESCAVFYGSSSISLEDPSEYDGCSTIINGSDLQVELTQAPDSNDFNISHAYVSVCGDISIQIEYSVSTPGDYQGYFTFSEPDNCQPIQVPFHFTITEPEDNPPLVPESVNWYNGYSGDYGLFNGGESCSISSYSYISLDDPTGYNGCWSGNLGSGVELEIIQAPDSSDLSLTYVYAELCYGNGFLQVPYSVSTQGDYQGYFNIFPPGSCQIIQVPFQFTISDPENGVLASEGEWEGTFDGATTCPNSTDYNSAYFNDPTGYNDCWGGYLGSGVELEITQAPDSSDFSLDYVYAQLCYGDLYINVEHSVSTPGDYQGYFNIIPSGSCQIVQVPFQFTIYEPESAALTSEGEWNGTFDGATTCPNSNDYNSAYFNDPTGYNDCWGGNLGSGVELEITQAPDSSDFSLDYVYAELCYGNLYIDVEHSVSTSGVYQGYFVISAPDNCQDVHVPFQFTISDPENVFTTIEDEWNGTFDGATTCPTSEGYNYAYFNDPTGYNDCWGGNLDSGVELEITQAPDSSDFSLDYVYAELCYGTLLIDVHHSVSTLGDYQGYFIISAPDNCLDIRVPFQFTISDPEDNMVLASEGEWNGIFDGATTCPTSNSYNYAYFNDPTGYNDCWESDLGLSFEVEMSQVPDFNDFSIEYANAELCYGDLYIDVQHSVSTPGDYQGYFNIIPPGSCQGVQVPFAFTISEEELPPSTANSVEWYQYDYSDYGLFNGGETCFSQGWQTAFFESNTNGNDCSELSWGDGISIEFTEAPDTTDFSVDYAWGMICGMLDIQYSVSTPGNYEGHFVLEGQESCQPLLVPFQFAITEPDSSMTTELFWENELFTGGEFCPVSSEWSSSSYNYDGGYDGCWIAELGYDLEMEMIQAPDSNDFNLEFAQVWICPELFGDENWIDLQFSVSTPGAYSGYFTSSLPGACETIQLPFEFVVMPLDALGICGGNCEADIDSDGICDDVDDCIDVNDDGDCDNLIPELCGIGTYYDEALNLCMPHDCPGDFDLSLQVSTGDLLILLSEFGLYCDEDSIECISDNDQNGICDEYEFYACGQGTFYDSETEQCLPSANCPTDMNDSGSTGMSDLLEFLTMFGLECQ
jgi:hypothetical protein